MTNFLKATIMVDIFVVPETVLRAYCSQPELCVVSSLGCGNINDTFLVESSVTRFVLQRINKNVFPEPLRVIQNFPLISRHLLSQNRECEEQFKIADPLLTRRGDLFYHDKNGEYWRAQSYIPHTSNLKMSGSHQAFQAGRILALFHSRIRDLDVSCLQDPLPGFHDLSAYLEVFDGVVQEEDVAGDDIRYCLKTIAHYRMRADAFLEAQNDGTLAYQPIHGDPKNDNFFFNEKGLAFGMLDLDTVRSGLVHHDLGDCLRSCCNTSGEAGNSGEIVFDMDLCQSLLEGYFSICYSCFTEQQRVLIFDGLLLITFELGVRFLTDHFRGNTYFKVNMAGENLDRAINQFRLTDDIERCENNIKKLLC